MRKRAFVTADEPVPYGATVLVRGVRASLAGPELANGRAVARPAWLGEGEVIPARFSFSVEMLDHVPDLQALANGPIMNPVSRFAPSGRLSWAEAKAREAAQILEWAL